MSISDDAALLAKTRIGAEQALQDCSANNTTFGLRLSTFKTKFMSAGREVKSEDRPPIEIENSEIECVKEFPYLGSIIAANRRMDPDVEKRLSQASKAFGALRKSVFSDKNLSLCTKREVYQECVISVLLYGSECWIPLKKHLRKLDSFHHRCIRMILVISSKAQWQQRITNTELRRRWEDPRTISTGVRSRHLEWLGHLACMPNHRLPKTALFSWLPQPRPSGGPRRR